jgi:hypothetical protein
MTETPHGWGVSNLGGIRKTEPRSSQSSLKDHEAASPDCRHPYGVTESRIPPSPPVNNQNSKNNNNRNEAKLKMTETPHGWGVDMPFKACRGIRPGAALITK